MATQDSNKKISTNSNTYTLVYAAVMVIIVAFLLSFVSSALREKQQANVKLDTKKQILSSLNIANVDADAYFTANVKDMLWNGDTLVAYQGEFSTLYETEGKAGNFHVFVCNVDGKTKYVIPVYGAGLWGAVWGYVSLDENRNTIYGTYFSHASETPGLGAEITTDWFQNQFIGKKTTDSVDVKISVVKNGKVQNAEYEVDGISGGTITSTGVDAMLKSCLNNYKNFLTK